MLERARLSEREACKAIVGALVLAAAGHEVQLASELDRLPDLLALTVLFAPLPSVTVALLDLAGFDVVLGVVQV